MTREPSRSWQFLVRFARATAAPAEQELLIDGPAVPRSATLYLPEPRAASGAAWVFLHGVTVPGRHHAAVRRMARTLASVGDMVLVPEVARWTALEVAPEETAPALHDALEQLRRRSDLDASRIGLVGFSVAATWGLEAAATVLRDAFRAVVAAGAYADLARMVRAMVLGEHEWRGRVERYRPDPYGRWILGGTLLRGLEGDEWGSAAGREAAAQSLRRLALTAGRHGAIADQPVYDPLIADLRRGLPADVLPAWDLLAPPSTVSVPEAAAAGRLAHALAATATANAPLLDPAGQLPGLRPGLRVALLHGRGDRLIPYTECLRLCEALPAHVERRPTVTRLLGHTKRSEAAGLFNPLTMSAELRTFARFATDLVSALDEEEAW